MSNAVLDKAVEQADLIDTWVSGKHRFVSIDMADAGPVPGAWDIIGVGSVVQKGDGGPFRTTFHTAEAHGLAVGEKVALFGSVPGAFPVWASSEAVSKGFYRVPKTANGKKYLCIKAGTTGNNEPSWPTVDGEVVGSGSTVFRCEGAASQAPENGNFSVVAVPASVTFEIDIPTKGAGFASLGFVANLSKTYLSEFAPLAARTATSLPLTGKVVLPGPVLDCNDSSLDLTVADSSEVILLLKTAALDADPDLADTAQRIIAYYDTMPALPIAANAGIVALPISNTADRLMRL